MRFKHPRRAGFRIGFIDFFTAGIFPLFYMPPGGLQAEIDGIPGHPAFFRHPEQSGKGAEQKACGTNGNG